MTRLSTIFLAALIAMSASSASAQAAPPSEALVERFMAAIPEPQGQFAPTLPAADEVERLEALNPGRSADFRPILETYEACAASESRTRALALLRNVARALGETKLLRLTEFYEGPDYAAFAPLAERMGRGEEISAEEKAKFEKLVADYPLNEFRETMMSVAMSDAALAGPADNLAGCSLAMRKAFEAGRLRLE